MFRVIANTAVAVGSGMDVVEAEIRLVEAEVTHMAVAKGTLMEAMVHLSGHKTRPNPCVIDLYG